LNANICQEPVYFFIFILEHYSHWLLNNFRKIRVCHLDHLHQVHHNPPCFLSLNSLEWRVLWKCHLSSLTFSYISCHFVSPNFGVLCLLFDFQYFWSNVITLSKVPFNNIYRICCLSFSFLENKLWLLSLSVNFLKTVFSSLVNTVFSTFYFVNILFS
jgi:hypothetical protein